MTPIATASANKPVKYLGTAGPGAHSNSGPERFVRSASARIPASANPSTSAITTTLGPIVPRQRDYRGNQRVVSEEKLPLRAYFGRRVVGNIAEHGARRHGFSKHIEALFERGNAKVLRASGIDGDEI